MSESNRNSGGPQSQNVRHIPIYVEGRDKPLLNTISPSNSGNDSSEFFDDPVKSMGRTFSGSNAGSGTNPFPINTHTTTTNSSSSCNSNNSKSNIHHNYDTVDGGPPNNKHYTDPIVPPNPQQQQQQYQYEDTAPALSAGQPPKNETTIEKIQSIQRDVLHLMDRIEHYKCHSKRDREYVYLDEMLTQHLLKLDTIDSDGNEIIKKARREAIKSINKCIEALEAKAEAAKLDANGPNTNITNNSIDNSISSQTAIT